MIIREEDGIRAENLREGIDENTGMAWLCGRFNLTIIIHAKRNGK
jgi:hypothetical protein